MAPFGRSNRVFTISLAVVVVFALLCPADEPMGGKQRKNGFVTDVGTSHFFDGRVAIEVSTPGKDRFALRITSAALGARVKQEPYFEVDGLLKKGKAWFVYVEGAERFWAFDGDKEAALIQFVCERAKLPGGGESATCNVKYKAADADLLKSAPEAVRKRLPKALIEQASQRK